MADVWMGIPQVANRQLYVVLEADKWRLVSATNMKIYSSVEAARADINESAQGTCTYSVYPLLDSHHCPRCGK